MTPREEHDAACGIAAGCEGGSDGGAVDGVSITARTEIHHVEDRCTAAYLAYSSGCHTNKNQGHPLQSD